MSCFDYEVPVIRRRLADVLTTLGVRGWDHLPEEVIPPAATVHVESIEYDLAMDRGLDRLVIIITLFASKGSARAAQHALDELMEKVNGRSLKAAIEATRNHDTGALDGAAHDVRVVQLRRVGPLDYNALELWGAEFEVEVYA